MAVTKYGGGSRGGGREGAGDDGAGGSADAVDRAWAGSEVTRRRTGRRWRRSTWRRVVSTCVACAPTAYRCPCVAHTCMHHLAEAGTGCEVHLQRPECTHGPSSSFGCAGGEANA